MQGGEPDIGVADVPPDAEISESDWAEYDTTQRVRVWLSRMKRLPYGGISPKDVSTVAAMTDKWGWDFVKMCLDKALDAEASRPIPYAETVANSEAAKRFVNAEKANRPRKWRAG